MRRPRRKLWIFAIIIVAGATGAGVYHLRREKPLKVRVAHTEKLPRLKQLVKGSGEIRTEDSIDIQAEIAGVIIEIPVREGDKVQKGQVLLKIDPFQTDADVQAARAQLGAGPLVAPMQAVALRSDPSDAREVARDFCHIYLGLPNYTNNLRRLGFTDDDQTPPGSDRLVDAVVAWGSVDDITARVQAHLDAGADHVCLQVLGADHRTLPVDQLRELVG